MRFVIFNGSEILNFNPGLLSLEHRRALLEEGGNAFAEVFRAAGIALGDPLIMQRGAKIVVCVSSRYYA